MIMPAVIAYDLNWSKAVKIRMIRPAFSSVTIQVAAVMIAHSSPLIGQLSNGRGR
jgi:hypothetical protein